MTDYEHIYEEFGDRPHGPYFRLLTILPKNPDLDPESSKRVPQKGDIAYEDEYIRRTYGFDPAEIRRQRLIDSGVEIKPEDTDLEVDLSIHRFEGCPEYEALSYSWGNTDGMKYAVKCNGHKFLALTSLKNALHALRLPDKPRVVWIDAICINQNSDTRAVTERAQQLQMMQHIYKNAKRAVVWLGLEREWNYAPAFKDTDNADLNMIDPINFNTGLECAISLHLDALMTDPGSLWKGRVEIEATWGPRIPLIKQSALHIKEEWDRRTENDPRDMNYEKIMEKGMISELPRFLHKTATSVVNMPSIKKKLTAGLTTGIKWWFTLRNLLCREWWSRVWIIQEVCLSKDIILCCGDMAVTLDLLYLGMVLQSAFPDNALFSGVSMASWTLPQVMEYRNLYQHQKGANLPSLLHLLTEFRSSDATDPKDHVYSLLGLLAPGELTALAEAGFKPDYSKGYTVGRCFTDTASSMVASSNNLNMLALPRPGRVEIAKSRAGELPSWVPDWSAKTTLILTPKHGFEAANTKLGAPLFSTCGTSHQAEARVLDGSVLLVSGYAVDTVASTVTDSLPGLTDALLDFIQSGFKEDFHSEEKTSDLGTKGIMLDAKDIMIDMFSSLGKFTRTIYAWEEFVAGNTSSYPTGEDMEKVHCAVRCFGYTPDGLEAAVNDFQEYKKAMSGGRRVYNLVLSPSRPSLPSFLKRKPAEEKAETAEPSKVRQALMGLARPDEKSRVKMVKFNNLQKYSVGRKLAWTEKGYLALVSEETDVGDKIMLCKGSRLPVVVRASEQPNQWRALSGCYVHGIMNGEAWDEVKCAEMQIV